jgi:hypothetical protein
LDYDLNTILNKSVDVLLKHKLDWKFHFKICHCTLAGFEPTLLTEGSSDDHNAAFHDRNALAEQIRFRFNLGFYGFLVTLKSKFWERNCPINYVVCNFGMEFKNDNF